jgi:hypothetical protein
MAMDCDFGVSFQDGHRKRSTVFWCEHHASFAEAAHSVVVVDGEPYGFIFAPEGGFSADCSVEFYSVFRFTFGVACFFDVDQVIHMSSVRALEGAEMESAFHFDDVSFVLDILGRDFSWWNIDAALEELGGFLGGACPAESEPEELLGS